jgi:outer membrane protein OmpA-like peptidoglycan-associated protein
MERTINYLVSKGFTRELITGGYKGEDEPDVICDSCSEEQFTKNRRTVIQVID